MQENQKTPTSTPSREDSSPTRNEIAHTRARPDAIQRSHSEKRLCNEDRATEDAEGVVLQYIETKGIEVLFDGTLCLRGRPLQALTPDDIDSILGVDSPTVPDLLDEIFLTTRKRGPCLKRTELSAALRQVVRDKKRTRYQFVMRKLLDGCSGEENQEAQAQWARVGDLFEVPGELAIAILRHFCWSVKQKQLGRPVVHHCMPIIYSSMQGTGKTVFVKKFLAPLRELATDSALFTDLADKRNADIFRFPVILLDDMERIPASLVPILKSVLTSDRIRRRRLGTSLSEAIPQACVPIGTSNQQIHELVEDDTGHRRFAVLPFRNGAVVKGGDSVVWATVNSINFELLWRSVDAFAQSPLLPYLKDLQPHGSGEPNKTALLGWLETLDLDCEAVRNITTRHGVRARGLHTLFMVQTGIEISAHRFAVEMDRFCLRPDTPFSDKIKTEIGALYRTKRRAADRPGREVPLTRPEALLGRSATPASSGPSGSSGLSVPQDESIPPQNESSKAGF